MKTNPSTNKFLKSTISRIICSGFGSGLVSRAPGTIGSATFTLLWIVLLNAGFLSDLTSRVCFVVLISLIGFVCVYASIEDDPSESDPSWIVIDEWAGMGCALTALSSFSWFGILVSFGFFRLFDILKPGPVRWAEKIPGALGVMMDDIVAGLLSALFIYVLRPYI